MIQHNAYNGIVFTSATPDLLQGVTVIMPERELSIDEIVADTAEFGAWFVQNIHPTLNGFQGMGAVKYHTIPHKD
jgi:hypothetical protein